MNLVIPNTDRKCEEHEPEDSNGDDHRHSMLLLLLSSHDNTMNDNVYLYSVKFLFAVFFAAWFLFQCNHHKRWGMNFMQKHLAEKTCVSVYVYFRSLSRDASLGVV